MIAVDTNILVYAVDAGDPARSERAVGLLRRLESEPTILLWQVICEFGAALLRKKPKSDVQVEIADVVEAWLGIYPLVLPSVEVARTAWRLIAAHQMSHWDAFLIAACVDAGVTRLYTEDMQGKPVIEGVEIVNPFR